MKQIFSEQTTQDTPQQGALNQKEAALFLGISTPILRGLIRRRAIPYRQVGRQFLFSVDALKNWLTGNDENETAIAED